MVGPGHGRGDGGHAADFGDRVGGVFPGREYLAASLGDRVAGLSAQHFGPDVWGRRRCAGGRHRRRLVGGDVRFSGSADVRVGLAAAPGDAGLRHRLCLHRPIGIRRPISNLAAHAVWLARQNRLLVSGNPLDGRRRGDDDLGALPLCLRDGAGRLYRAIGRRAGGQSHSRTRALARIL